MSAVDSRRTSPWMVLLIVAIAVFLLADVGIAAFRLTSFHAAAGHPSTAQAGLGGSHPCNHGAYVSAAAHAHKGGAYVSKVARGNLGKSAGCSAPLPNGS